MTQVMKGVRVLEVAQFIFVPAAGALLADWGAEVIKIEHPVRGDAQRGLMRASGVAVDMNRNPVLEHANRGKRSVGLDISTPEGQALLYELAKTADVFLTNYLPETRQKLRIDVEHIRAVNPNIIYARGGAHGEKGPERNIGGFDVTSFWSRGGIAWAMTPEAFEAPLMQPIGGFGDSISAMSLAGGVAAALFHRANTGEATEVDVSLVSTAAWIGGVAVNTAAQSGQAPRATLPKAGGAPRHPFLGNFRTADGRFINLFTMQPDPHIRSLFEHIGRPELADDPRFANSQALADNWEAANEALVAAFASQPFAHWREHLKTYSGQWAPAQSFADLVTDEQALANDMLFEVEAIDGGPPIRLARGPAQFGGAPVATTRSPQAAEHTEAVLLELGKDWDEIERLKSAGVVT
jgi:crotonobetainyl-CoA:carnitine CoA-transferase CaiB-like acyl-CoA transferase